MFHIYKLYCFSYKRNNTLWDAMLLENDPFPGGKGDPDSHSLNITQLQCFLKGNTYNIECLKQYKVLALL